MDDGKSSRSGKPKVIELPRQKAASGDDVIAFIRALLINAHETQISIFVCGIKSDEGMQAQGIVMDGETSRSVDRLLDLVDNWATEREYEIDDA